jgi:hypothetical protein
VGWLLHITGIDNPAGRWYAFWSGFGSDLAYVAAIGAAFHHLNCHEGSCWRLARHANDGYCRKHRRIT